MLSVDVPLITRHWVKSCDKEKRALTLLDLEGRTETFPIAVDATIAHGKLRGVRIEDIMERRW